MTDINIRVYAQFALTPPPNGDEERRGWLDSANWKWTNCLTFPVEKPNTFSCSPYKWIRYATGIVVGAHGDLFFQDSANPIVYDSSLPVSSVDLYYRVTDNERLRKFPLDPTLANTRIITTTGDSTRRFDFRNDVEQRDGDRCVLTDVAGNYCDAAHLLAHSKGDSYVEAFTRGRCRDPDDVIVKINDVRNGLFLNRLMHAAFGIDIAVLMTPNFAMDSHDVDIDLERTETIFTPHLFNDSNTNLLPRVPLSVRVPNDLAKWPPAVLFDATYASAVVHNFNALPQGFLDGWATKFYPGGPTTTAHADEQHRHEQAAMEKAKRQVDERRERYERRHDKKHDEQGDGGYKMDIFDLLLNYKYIGMQPEAAARYEEKCQEANAARNREELETKVSSWRQEISADTHLL